MFTFASQKTKLHRALDQPVQAPSCLRVAHGTQRSVNTCVLGCRQQVQHPATLQPMTTSTIRNPAPGPTQAGIPRYWNQRVLQKMAFTSTIWLWQRRLRWTGYTRSTQLLRETVVICGRGTHTVSAHLDNPRKSRAFADC